MPKTSNVDFLTRILGDMVDDEAINVLVVFTTEAQAIQVSSNAVPRATCVGMLETAKIMLLGEGKEC